MNVNIKLTKKGLENYDKVVEATFQYLNKLKESGPQERIFKEINEIGYMSFEY